MSIHRAAGARSAKQWPVWIDDVLAFGPIAELEVQYRAAIGDAIVYVLDMRQGTREITCACCGSTKIAPARGVSEGGR